MKRYIIAYDFYNDERDYSPFYEEIKKNFPEHRRIMKYAWIVRCDKTAREIVKLLAPYLYFKDDDSDSLFVTEINVAIVIHHTQISGIQPYIAVRQASKGLIVFNGIIDISLHD